MCGRYVVVTPPGQLAIDFAALVDPDPPAAAQIPDYNVAPTTLVPAVLVREAGRTLTTLQWGLVPFWAKDPSIGARMINARVETAAEKPAFRRAFAKRRCLLPADGYYEWRKPDLAAEGVIGSLAGGAGAGAKGKPRKQPYFIHDADGAVLAFAGLYESWRGPDGRELWSVTILTGPAPGRLAAIHDRIPLTVAPGNREAWLDADLQQPEAVRSLLEPDPDWSARPIGDRVNSVRNNGPELIVPVGPQSTALGAAGVPGPRGAVEIAAAGSPEPGMAEPDTLF